VCQELQTCRADTLALDGCARERLGSQVNETQATLLAYDLRSGGFLKEFNPPGNPRLCRRFLTRACHELSGK